MFASRFVSVQKTTMAAAKLRHSRALGARELHFRFINRWRMVPENRVDLPIIYNLSNCVVMDGLKRRFVVLFHHHTTLKEGGDDLAIFRR